MLCCHESILSDKSGFGEVNNRMKMSSKGCFILSVVWILVSLIWFLWVKNTAIGLIWLCIGIVEFLVAAVLRFKENRK